MEVDFPLCTPARKTQNSDDSAAAQASATNTEPSEILIETSAKSTIHDDMINRLENDFPANRAIKVKRSAALRWTPVMTRASLKRAIEARRMQKVQLSYFVIFLVADELVNIILQKLVYGRKPVLLVTFFLPVSRNP